MKGASQRDHVARIGVVLLMLSMLVSACGGEPESVRTTRQFYEGIQAGDESVAELICASNPLGSVLGLLGFGMQFAGADEIAFEDMSYELIGEDESMAKVRVSGSVVALYNLSGGTKRESEAFEQVVVLKKEAGQWCVNLSPW